MKHTLLTIFSGILFVSGLRAQDKARFPVQFEVAGARVLRPDYLISQPDVATAMRGYCFSGGWEYTLTMAAPVRKNLAVAMRWKQAVFANERMVTVFWREYPGRAIHYAAGSWAMNQANLGLFWQAPDRKLQFRAGQFVGLSLVKIPSLLVSGQEGQYTTLFITRQTQWHQTLSLYTVLGLTYRYSARRYLFANGEWSYHYAGQQGIELDAFFGAPEINKEPQKEGFWNYSLNFGVGWNLGKD